MVDADCYCAIWRYINYIWYRFLVPCEGFLYFLVVCGVLWLFFAVVGGIIWNEEVMKVLAEERRQVILRMLQQHGIVNIQDICRLTDCSMSSARRDLQLLEEEGLLHRVHGGAQIKRALQSEMTMTDKSSKNHDQKVMIAQKAAALIQDDDVIYLDSGSTTLELARILDATKKITVVTNSVLSAAVLSDHGIDTIVLGGRLKNNTRAIAGADAAVELSKYRFNRAFLGINAIHATDGLMTPDPDEAAVKRMALRQSDKNYVMADSTKFDQVSFVKVADCTDATIITDDNLSPRIAKRFVNQTFI